jgi:hypothetical protein
MTDCHMYITMSQQKPDGLNRNNGTHQTVSVDNREELDAYPCGVVERYVFFLVS